MLVFAGYRAQQSTRVVAVGVLVESWVGGQGKPRSGCRINELHQLQSFSKPKTERQKEKESVRTDG